MKPWWQCNNVAKLMRQACVSGSRLWHAQRSTSKRWWTQQWLWLSRWVSLYTGDCWPLQLLPISVATICTVQAIRELYIITSPLSSTLLPVIPIQSWRYKNKRLWKLYLVQVWHILYYTEIEYYMYIFLHSDLGVRIN